jgi:hypothetical protein
MFWGIILIYEIIKYISNKNLLKAAYYGYVDIVRALLQAGAEVNIATNNAVTALMAGIIVYFYLKLTLFNNL